MIQPGMGARPFLTEQCLRLGRLDRPALAVLPQRRAELGRHRQGHNAEHKHRAKGPKHAFHVPIMRDLRPLMKLISMLGESLKTIDP
jgi:hypothetical protein